jgi:hypothetical protein
MLEDYPDLALLDRKRTCIPSVEQDSALVREFEPGEDAQQGRLARAGRPEKANELPPGNG